MRHIHKYTLVKIISRAVVAEYSKQPIHHTLYTQPLKRLFFIFFRLRTHFVLALCRTNAQNMFMLRSLFLVYSWSSWSWSSSFRRLACLYGWSVSRKMCALKTKAISTLKWFGWRSTFIDQMACSCGTMLVGNSKVVQNINAVVRWLWMMRKAVVRFGWALGASMNCTTLD